jgi:hypothetical protein
MITHLKGRPCRQPAGSGLENDAADWSRVTCPGCRQSKKYDRLREDATKKAARPRS